VLISAVAAPPLPAFDVPLGRLLELDILCAAPGTYTLTLTAVPEGPFGAVYFETSTVPIYVVQQSPGVADTHQVTCLSPSTVQDSDNDGCQDVRELVLNQMQGGYRDPSNFGDFYDVPTGPGLTRSGSVAGPDIFAVIARFGTAGNPNGDPLSAPPAAGYHTAFDRGSSVGPNGWNVSTANGSVAMTDIMAAISQFGHTCT
jgi:hypothetical protein